jgi:SAM-dependent methyltransferase
MLVPPMKNIATSWNGNRTRYEIDDIVNDYVGRSELLPAEAATMNLLGSILGGMRMLDIGIGGGRTTLHFANRVREYVGIDYAEGMVEACRARFPALASSIRVGDVRNLKGLAGFDFILFSHNGLDMISFEDRLTALREIRPAAAPGAYFLFSSHNLRSLGTMGNRRLTRDPRSFARRLLINGMVRWINGNLRTLRNRDHAVVRDDGCGFSLATCYVRPGEQLRRLEEAGFTGTRIISAGGLQREGVDADAFKDEWLHYLARVPA